MQKGQGALEYLLLIGGAVLVAVIVISTVLSIADEGGANTQATSTAASNLLTQKRAEVLGTAPVTGGIVAFANFNEGSGTTVSLGDAGSGTINGATWVTPGRNGKGSALSFNGTNNISANPGNLPTGPVATVSAWIKPTSFAENGNYTGIVSWGSRACTGTSFLMSVKITSIPTFASWCNDFTNGTGTTIPLNVWTHYALVLNGTTVTAYLNGVQTQSGTLSGDVVPNITSQNLRIGSTDLTGRYFSGEIDDVAIYDRTLTPAEIAVLAGT